MWPRYLAFILQLVNGNKGVNMNQKKIIPIMLFVVLFMLIFNFIFALYEYLEFQDRIESGNDRWKQVEERIEEIERCCNWKK